MATDDLVSGANGYRPFAPFSSWADVRVGEAWGEFLAGLEAARSGVESTVLRAALDIALRSAALETGAIEGLYTTNRGVTHTVALQGAMWEAELEKLGVEVRGHFEAQLAALELVLDAATKRLPISEAWLRELHGTVCSAQRTYTVSTAAGPQQQLLPHGEYKTSPNNVMLADGTIHWYASPLDVESEMHRLVEEMRSEPFQSAHPVLQAAFAHHALTAVHPFADGNGRAARALASVFLYRVAGVPLVIFSDQQLRYWDALAEADAERPMVFVTFVEERALDTMALITDRLREATSPLDAQAAALRKRFHSHGGLTHAEVQVVGRRLTDHLQQTFVSESNRLTLEPDVRSNLVGYGDRTDCTFWDLPYHPLAMDGRFTFTVSCEEPIKASVDTTPIVGVANDVESPFAFIVIDANRSSTLPLKLRVTDLHPALSTFAETRIDSWVKQAISAAIRELQRALDSALLTHGYSA